MEINKTKKILTLCLVCQDKKVLLGMKKRGFGAGRWNGFGGKLSPGETIEEAAKREILEEAEINVEEMEKVGEVDFEFQGNPEIMEVHIFKTNNFLGNPKETEEMRPQWFNIDNLPFKDMWPDDIHWMPLFFAGKKFKGKFLFGKSDIILEQNLIEVQEI